MRPLRVSLSLSRVLTLRCLYPLNARWRSKDDFVFDNKAFVLSAVEVLALNKREHLKTRIFLRPMSKINWKQLML